MLWIVVVIRDNQMNFERVVIVLMYVHAVWKTFERYRLKIRSSILMLHMSHRMGKPTICIRENKGADQLRYMDSTIPFLLVSKF